MAPAKKNKETAKEKKDKVVLSGFEAAMKKQFGEGTIFSFDMDDKDAVKVYPIPFGIPQMDYASGVGGAPLGRIIELYGPESSGKSTICLKCVSEFQKLSKILGNQVSNKKALYIDAEHALDPMHMQALGVDMLRSGNLLINQPESGEQVFDIIEAACNSGEVGMIVVDSVAAMVPMKETENDMNFNPIGLQARMMSQGLRKIGPVVKKSNVLVIFVNQIRMKVGVMHGNPETQPGGQALRFYASMRIDVRRKPIRKGDVDIGQEITVKYKKNKVSRPFTKATFDYYWDTGIDVIKNIMDVAVDMDIIHQRGAYYFLGSDPEDTKSAFSDALGNKLMWQGKAALEDTLKASPGLYDYINDMVLGRIPRDTQFVEENTIDEPAEHDDPAEEIEMVESLV